MKVLKILFVVFVVVVVEVLAVQLDLAFNPWLKDSLGSWQGYNYLTSEHALTVLYLMHGWTSVAVIAVLLGSVVGVYLFLTQQL